jgi:regulatory protein
MHITSIAPTRHDPDRVAIVLDDRSVLACHISVLADLGLVTGDEITSETIEQLKDSEVLHALQERAITLLAGRPRGRQELRQRLLQGTKKHPNQPAEHVDKVLDRLAELGLIDDSAFATFWVEQRDRFRPKGAQALQAELRSKGVERAAIESAIEPERDLERAISAAERRAIQITARSGIDAVSFRNTLGPFLQRRGFNYSTIRAALAELWQRYATDDTDGAFDEIDG